MPGPLNGVRVVDLSTVLMGPYATQTLGEMGADVIKVESREGDLMRQIAPMRNPGMGHLFLNVNRSKRSIAIDLKSPEGRAALLKVAATADVFVYNIRLQAMARLGLTYEDIAAVNPKVIYLGLFGYGEAGPYAGKPAYDDLIQGLVTLPSLIAAAGAGTPQYVPTAFSDRVVALMAVNAALAALFHRERTGQGQRIDIPMFESMATFVLNDHLAGKSFDPPIGAPGYVRHISKERRPYRTNDGYVCTMIYNDKQWQGFVAAVRDDAPFVAEPRYADFNARITHSDELLGQVSDLFLTRSTADWMEILTKADIPATPLHTLETIFDDPHLKAVGFFREEQHPTEGTLRRMPAAGEWSETQPDSSRPVPRLGEHSAEILQEAGYSAVEIEALRAKNIIG